MGGATQVGLPLQNVSHADRRGQLHESRQKIEDRIIFCVSHCITSEKIMPLFFEQVMRTFDFGKL